MELNGVTYMCSKLFQSRAIPLHMGLSKISKADSPRLARNPLQPAVVHLVIKSQRQYS